MELVEILNEGLRRSYRLTISGTEIGERVDQKVDELRPEAQKRGFRPGRVPKHLLKAQYSDVLRTEVVRESLESRLESHLEESGDRLVSQPQVDPAGEPPEDGGFQCDITYEIRPAIPELDFTEFQIARPVLSNVDAPAEKFLRKMALSNATHEAAGDGYAASDGDKVWADISGLCDGKPYEGSESEDVELIANTDAPEKSFQALVAGGTVGQVLKTIQRLPSDEQLGEASGGISVLSATVKSIERAVPPEINDAFAVDNGFADLEELKGMARERAADEGERVSKAIVRRRLFDKLDTVLEFELPPTSLSSETERVRQSLEEEQKEKTAASEETGSGNGGEGDIAEESERLAARRLRIGFFMLETAERNDLRSEFTDDELIQNAMAGSVNQWLRYRIEGRLKSDPAFRANLVSKQVERNTVEYILNLATVSDEPVSHDQMMALHAELYSG